MKALLDACVLYPTVMREVLLGVAAAGLFEPLWSPRILEEWARAAAKLGPGQETLARGEIAVAEARFPGASVQPRAGDAQGRDHQAIRQPGIGPGQRLRVERRPGKGFGNRRAPGGIGLAQDAHRLVAQGRAVLAVRQGIQRRRHGGIVGFG